jgi:hypothetical protein
MTDVMDRAFRGFLLTLGRIDEDQITLIERAFKSGMLVMMAKITECQSEHEFHRLSEDILREAMVFMETVPCTCRKCRRDRSGAIAPKRRGHRGPS